MCGKHYVGVALLLQQNRGSAHKSDAPPIPHHDNEDAWREEGFHGKPHFSETSILMDALQKNKTSHCHCIIFVDCTLHPM